MRRPGVVLLSLSALLPIVLSAGETSADPGNSAAPTRQTERAGRVPATNFRPMLPAADPAMKARLAGFRVDPEPFAWRMKLRRRIGKVAVHDVKFPSPWTSPVECNNTVHARYFVAPGEKPRPAVIVLHILADPKFRVARTVSYQLASQGIHALMVMMPYYGERRPADESALRDMTRDPETLLAGVRQGVMDVRRAARWLGTLPEVDANRIGICGVSLGGFVTATVAGVDGRFPRVAVVLAGGDLTNVLSGDAREVRGFREAIRKQGLSEKQVRALLAPIDPLTYASRLASTKVLMLNATNDEIVPVECARRFAEASGAELSWYRAGHYSMALFLPIALKQVSAHFSPPDWNSRRAQAGDDESD